MSESPNRLASSLGDLADNAPDHPAYWRGWFAGRASGLEVGWERGWHAGVRAASEELARELLHEQAADVARVAAGEAVKRHGPAWAWLTSSEDDET